MFLRTVEVFLPQIAAHREVMAIFRGLSHSSPLYLPLAMLLARWLRSGLPFKGRRAANAFARSHRSPAPHNRGPSTVASSIKPIAALSPQPNYVWAPLYSLEDTDA